LRTLNITTIHLSLKQSQKKKFNGKRKWKSTKVLVLPFRALVAPFPRQYSQSSYRFFLPLLFGNCSAGRHSWILCPSPWFGRRLGFAGDLSPPLLRLTSKGHISQVSLSLPQLFLQCYWLIPDEAMKKLKFTSTIQDLVVHILELKAIIESEAIKKKIFIELDKILQPSATLLPYKRLLKCTLE
jgi:hypothetical protein